MTTQSLPRHTCLLCNLDRAAILGMLREPVESDNYQLALKVRDGCRECRAWFGGAETRERAFDTPFDLALPSNWVGLAPKLTLRESVAMPTTKEKYAVKMLQLREEFVVRMLQLCEEYAAPKRQARKRLEAEARQLW